MGGVCCDWGAVVGSDGANLSIGFGFVSTQALSLTRLLSHSLTHSLPSLTTHACTHALTLVVGVEVSKPLGEGDGREHGVVVADDVPGAPREGAPDD